ncbi:MAG: transglutaminase family protein [Pseudomonadota bacterium]|nr:transglutaminase family protein [Pseudomonadota bacterium]
MEQSVSMSEQDAESYLRRLGEQGEGPHDIARAALMLSALDHPRHVLQPYEAHLAEIAEGAKESLRLISNVEECARALSALLAGRYGYDGDRITYDDPRNADLISVIDRRRGMPVALGVLYLHAARAAGLEAMGLNTPGHFLLRIAVGGIVALIDPFNGGAAVEREQLGAPPAMAGAVAGELGEIGFGEPVSDTDVLLRLENNLKLRALKTGERPRALAIAGRMALIAPARADLWLDLARLNEAAGSLGAAQKAYISCLALAKPGAVLHNEAVLGLDGLKRRLN